MRALGLGVLVVSACGGPLTSASEPPSQPLPAEATEPTLDAPFTTEGITLVSETTSPDGWQARFYRQAAYVCGVRGHHVFLVLTPPGAAWSDPLPLWVDLHGGGVGIFTASGEYVPQTLAESKLMDEPSAELLLRRFSVGAGARDVENQGSVWPPPAGLPKRVVDSKRFRVLLPSMCDNDTYSGVGAVDRLNPNRPDGQTPRVDGLLATRAALEFTRTTFPSPRTVLKGCSAGAVGVMSLAYRLSREGKSVEGVIAESATIHPAWQALYDRHKQGDTCFSWHVSDPAEHAQRIGPLMTPEFMPYRYVQRGELRSAVNLVWEPRDSLFCHDAAPVFQDLSDALMAQNPGGHSTVSKVCTTAECDVHCPLVGDAVDVNTGANVVDDVFTWAQARLQ